MIEKKIDIEQHYLYPSNFFVSDKPFIVTTVLGSCISVCLIDKEKNIGGINHFMLPLWNGEGLASAKYGNIAMEKLLARMISLGSRKNSIEAKMFGGANQSNFTMQIGARNREMAAQFLNEHKIPLVAESTLGTLGRKIIFNTSTGVVKMKLIRPASKNIFQD